MTKTVQALKVSASWTPNEATARAMMAPLDGTAAQGTRISGGRLALKYAIAISFTDAQQASRVAARVEEIKAALEATGTLHGFITTAGAVARDEAVILDPPKPEAQPDLNSAPAAAQAAEAGALPAGWSRRESDGALIVPDQINRKATTAEVIAARGHSALLASFDRVETESGTVLKSKDATAE